MSGGNPIIGPWPTSSAPIEAQTSQPQDETLLLAEPIADRMFEAGGDDTDYAEPDRMGALRIALIVATIAWIAFAGYAQYVAINGQGLALADVVNFVAVASAPLALIGLGWLAMNRSTRVQSHRVRRAIDDLRAEEARLDLIVDAVSARIDSARGELAFQADRLMTLGDEAGVRLEQVSGLLQTEVDSIGRHSTTLKTSAAAARADIAVLLSDLPKSLVQTRQLVSALRDAGETAAENAMTLTSQVETLAARSREAEDIAGSAATKLSEQLTNMESMSIQAGERLESSTTNLSGAVDAALERTSTALDAAREGMEAQSEAMLALIRQGQAAMTQTGTDAADTIAGRVDDVVRRMAEISSAFAEQDKASQNLVARMDDALTQIEQRLTGLDEAAPATVERVSVALLGLRDNAASLTSSLDEGGNAARQLIAQSETLLTALDASVREIDETLPAAQKRLQAAIDLTQGSTQSLGTDVGAIDKSADMALARLREVEQLIATQRQQLEQMEALSGRSLEEGRAAVAALGASIDDVNARARDVAETTSPKLAEALALIKETANQAVGHTREAFDSLVPASAQSLANSSREALQSALSDEVERHIARVSQAAEAAIAATNAATSRLMQQLDDVNKTTAALESRVAEARDGAERSDQVSFAKRVATIVDSLNSTAIDITKAFSTEVADTAWAEYHSGDRGVFTRKAVRLLDATETHEIVRHYEEDGAFRDNVNTYIHDFEAMLRHVLSTRDGNPLSVTLLSSDAGKLYVALAQAIDRLRT